MRNATGTFIITTLEDTNMHGIMVQVTDTTGTPIRSAVLPEYLLLLLVQPTLLQFPGLGRQLVPESPDILHLYPCHV